MQVKLNEIELNTISNCQIEILRCTQSLFTPKYDAIGGRMSAVLKGHLKHNTSLIDLVSPSLRVSASILGILGHSLEVVAVTFKYLTCSNDGGYRNNEDKTHQVEQTLKASLY